MSEFESLKKYYPDPSEINDLSEYDIYTLTNNIKVGKFVKADKLKDEEKKILGKKLNDEWIETVVKPYCKALTEFCEKYEIALLKSHVATEAMPLTVYSLQEMLEDMSEIKNRILNK